MPLKMLRAGRSLFQPLVHLHFTKKLMFSLHLSPLKWREAGPQCAPGKNITRGLTSTPARGGKNVFRFRLQCFFFLKTLCSDRSKIPKLFSFCEFLAMNWAKWHLHYISVLEWSCDSWATHVWKRFFLVAPESWCQSQTQRTHAFGIALTRAVCYFLDWPLLNTRLFVAKLFCQHRHVRKGCFLSLIVGVGVQVSMDQASSFKKKACWQLVQDNGCCVFRTHSYSKPVRKFERNTVSHCAMCLSAAHLQKQSSKDATKAIQAQQKGLVT